MIKAFQYFGTAVWGYMIFTGAMNIAAKVSERGSLAYILILVAFAPLAVTCAVRIMWSPGTTALLQRIAALGHSKGAEPEGGRCE